MVKKVNKLGRLQDALDQTLDKFLSETIDESELKEELPTPPAHIEEEAQKNSYLLSQEEMELVEKAAPIQGISTDTLIKNAIFSYCISQVHLSKEILRKEFTRLRAAIEKEREDGHSQDLNRKDLVLLLSYIRHIERLCEPD